MSASKSQTLPAAPSLAAHGRETFRLLFGTPLNASLTVLFGGLLLIAVPPVLRWSVLDAVWFDPDPASCRAAGIALVGSRRRMVRPRPRQLPRGHGRLLELRLCQAGTIAVRHLSF